MSVNEDPQKIHDLLSEDRLGFIVEKARLHAQIDQLLFKILPSTLRGRCRTLNLSGSTLMLQLDTAAAGFLLQAHLPALLAALKSHTEGRPIQEIRYKIRPENKKTVTPTQRAKPKLSLEVNELFESTARSIQHPQLKAALKKLGKNR